MRETIIRLIDDLDGSEANETISFVLDGVTYEIDLSEKNAASLRQALAPYTHHARTSGRPVRTRSTLPSAGNSRNAEIRAWAADQGHTLPERGRIPGNVVRDFDAGH